MAGAASFPAHAWRGGRNVSSTGSGNMRWCGDLPATAVLRHGPSNNLNPPWPRCGRWLESNIISPGRLAVPDQAGSRRPNRWSRYRGPQPCARATQQRSSFRPVPVSLTLFTTTDRPKAAEYPSWGTRSGADPHLNPLVAMAACLVRKVVDARLGRLKASVRPSPGGGRFCLPHEERRDQRRQK